MVRNRSADSIKRQSVGVPAHLLSLPDFCREYKLSRSLAYRLLRDGTLKGVKVGRLTRIRREDAEAWAATLQSYKPAA
jgi:excisionase family DNA binding protein